jgi:hypothetical protein
VIPHWPWYINPPPFMPVFFTKPCPNSKAEKRTRSRTSRQTLCLTSLAPTTIPVRAIHHPSIHPVLMVTSLVTGWDAHDGANQKVRFGDEACHSWLTFLQWLLESVGNRWAFKNVGNGRYLGLSGDVKDGTPLKAVDNRVEWDIYHDDKDKSVYR